jgi:hypothetical protein
MLQLTTSIFPLPISDQTSYAQYYSNVIYRVSMGESTNIIFLKLLSSGIFGVED